MVEVAAKMPTRSETEPKHKGLRASVVGLMLIIACPGDDIIPLAQVVHKLFQPESHSTGKQPNLDVENLLSMMWVSRRQEEKAQEDLAKLRDFDLLLKDPEGCNIKRVKTIAR